MRDTPEFGQSLLEDNEGKELLKQLILEKFEYYEVLNTRQEAFWSAEYRNALHPNIIRPEFLHELYKIMEEKAEVAVVERDLRNMCFQLNRSHNKFHGIGRWHEQYQRASQIGIDRVIGYFLGIDQFGRNIICPFHNEKKPSMKVYAKDNFFVCFSCQARGSPIDFVMQYKNCPFREAVLFLSNL